MVGDYRIPNLILPEEPDYTIGIWGQRRLDYLKKHKRGLYTNLLTSGKLTLIYTKLRNRFWNEHRYR